MDLRERISDGKLSAHSNIGDLGGGSIRARSTSDAEKKVGRTSNGRACANVGALGSWVFCSGDYEQNIKAEKSN